MRLAAIFATTVAIPLLLLGGCKSFFVKRDCNLTVGWIKKEMRSQDVDWKNLPLEEYFMTRRCKMEMSADSEKEQDSADIQ
jgi:hypothetical protein